PSSCYRHTRLITLPHIYSHPSFPLLIIPPPPRPPPFPYTTLFRSIYNCGTAPYTSLYHMPFILRLDRTRWSGSGFDWTVIPTPGDRKSTRLNSSHVSISYAVFCLKKKNTTEQGMQQCDP